MLATIATRTRAIVAAVVVNLALLPFTFGAVAIAGGGPCENPGDCCCRTNTQGDDVCCTNCVCDTTEDPLCSAPEDCEVVIE